MGNLAGSEARTWPRGTRLLDDNLQDRLGFHLLKRRDYEAYMAGEISRTEFAKRLAQEWASFPVPADVQGAHRSLTRGQSFYTGDALNKALVKPEEIERVLDESKSWEMQCRNLCHERRRRTKTICIRSIERTVSATLRSWGSRSV